MDYRTFSEAAAASNNTTDTCTSNDRLPETQTPIFIIGWIVTFTRNLQLVKLYVINVMKGIILQRCHLVRTGTSAVLKSMTYCNASYFRNCTCS